MKNIIAAVDFTACSDNAADYAADLAVAIGAELHLVHALGLPGTVREDFVPDYVLDEIRHAGFSHLSDLAVKLQFRTGSRIAIATDLESPSLPVGISNFCRWKHPFLVVRGSARTGQPSMKSIPYPTLSIPIDAKFTSIRKIVLTCADNRPEKKDCLPMDFLQQLCDLLHTELEILPIENTRQRLTAYLNANPLDWLVLFSGKTDVPELLQQPGDGVILQCPIPVPAYTQ